MSMRQSEISRLVLGTVQLGLEYGIANVSGKPSQEEANRIISSARKLGIVYYDTAQAYGESEKVLGIALCRVSGQAPKIISKLSPSLGNDSCENVEDDIARSLALLGVPSLDCLMLHREGHLSVLKGKIGALLARLVDKSIINRVGVSVYTIKCALEALDHPLISVLQVPASLFDRRFESAGVFKKAAELGKEIHIRSVLMQGVLCMMPDALPPFLKELSPYLKALRTVSSDNAVSPAVAALAWTMRRYPHARVLFGAETQNQVKENVNSIRLIGCDSLMANLDKILPPQNESLLSPVYWSNK